MVRGASVVSSSSGILSSWADMLCRERGLEAVNQIDVAGQARLNSKD